MKKGDHFSTVDHSQNHEIIWWYEVSIVEKVSDVEEESIQF